MAHADIAPGQEPPRRHGAKTLLRNESGDILLVRTRRKGGVWQLPGGGAYQNEPPHEARRRKFAEETGIDQPRTGDLILIDYTPPSATSGEGLNMLFNGGTVPDGAVITLPAALPGEDAPDITDYAFVPPDRLRDYCNEHQARRIEAALAVLADPTAPRYRYLGGPPPEPEEPQEPEEL
jgi:8-oxo-dGTP pyrophosphatase MutT (NUDIX family)